MMNNIPVYKIIFNETDDDETGLEQIAFVSEPAIMVKGVCLSAEEVDDDTTLHAMFLKLSSEDKMELSGPALIPDLPIKRYSEDLGYYYIVFDTLTIEKLVEKFNRNQGRAKFNLEHTETEAPAYMKENWIIIDPTKDKSLTLGFSELPVGSWFLTAKITDRIFWEKEIKANKRNAFSIEGLLGISMSKLIDKAEAPIKVEEQPEVEIQLNNNIKTTQPIMKRKFKFADYKLVDGSMISVDGDLAIGSDVYYIAEDGSKETIDAGEYVMETGEAVIVDAEGKISEIKAPEKVADAPADAPVEMAIDPEVLATLDELRAIIAELSSRVEALEAWKSESLDKEDAEDEAEAGNVAMSRTQLAANTAHKLTALKKFGNPFAK
jgi:hypothetical protein